jgi:2-keto-4-pentenoate hydratase/2-oxohepta-3-ene-1,7-dioic acid hydratase in catechol pathway
VPAVREPLGAGIAGSLAELTGQAVRLCVFDDPIEGVTVGWVVDAERVVPLPVFGIESALMEEDDLATIRRAIGVLEGAKGLTRSDLQLRAPIDPGKIVCVGLNYAEHIAEGGRQAPERPIIFGKFATAVVADGEPIIRPEGTHALDLEVELGVVIGRHARRVKAADAMDHVAGYVVVNDVSARDWQGIPAALKDGEKGDGQWLRAKGSDTFLPMGPIFVTADEVDPKAGLRLRSWRITPDGEEHLMQDGTTADMIRDVPTLIEFITAAITLEPGDVIATGTPSGVGVYRDPPVFLEPSDRVRCEIEGIGSVENPIVDWSEATA